jgi:aerobic carbon-monoxide dehydrogenase medium subunit
MLYFEPNFVDEALVLLDRFGPNARVLAGGTRLRFQLDHGDEDAKIALVNVKRIADMRGIQRTGAFLRVGALATAAALTADEHARTFAPLLVRAAETLGAVQLRNVATVGGNLCSGDPASDLSAALLACEARCELASSQEQSRSVGIEQLLAKGAPVLAAGELLVAVEIPIGEHRHAYEKVTTRRAFEMALVAVAARCRLEGDTLNDVHIALAGAGETPLRAAAAEAWLRGRRLDETTAREAGRVAAADDAKPVTDHRAGAAYRRQLVSVLTQRALLSMSSQATSTGARP